MAIVIVVAVVVGIIMFILGQNKERSMYAKTVGSAEEKSREIIDDAIRTAENKKREALLEAKEEALKAKNDLDKELKDRRKEVTELERRILKREESSEKKAASLERKESELLKKEEGLESREEEIEQIQKQKLVELERVSGLTKDQAKQELLHSVEDSIKHDTALIIREYDARAKEEAEKTAREYIVEAIQRCAADQVTESTVSVVQLPNDEMKGRIIGREGRNIRTLEQLTGVELIIDDTPEAVVLSGFDPVRREVARIALEKLIVDGRIHPTRIEEVVEKSRKEVNDTIKEEGESATNDEETAEEEGEVHDLRAGNEEQRADAEEDEAEQHTGTVAVATNEGAGGQRHEEVTAVDHNLDESRFGFAQVQCVLEIFVQHIEYAVGEAP